jgi:hypothetical protein
MSIPQNISDNSKAFYAIKQTLKELGEYVEEHQKKLSARNIDCDCTQWHIDCVKMVLDRIEFKLSLEDLKEYKNKNS